jgi:hypothetical protein
MASASTAKADCHVCHPVLEKMAPIRFHGESLCFRFDCEKAGKSPGLETRLSRRNSLEISKAETQSGMCEFDPSQGSHPVTQFVADYNLRATGPEFRAFRALALVSKLPVSVTRSRNRGKSPTYTSKTPVLRRLLAETGSITTAARSWHSVSTDSPTLSDDRLRSIRPERRDQNARASGERHILSLREGPSNG